MKRERYAQQFCHGENMNTPVYQWVLNWRRGRDAFQQRMNDLLGHLPYVRCYLDDILIVTKGDWKEHLGCIQTVLEVMGSAGLKVNAEKSFFGRRELDYLGYHISQEGIKPDTKKVEAIKALTAPKTVKIRHV